MRATLQLHRSRQRNGLRDATEQDRVVSLATQTVYLQNVSFEKCMEMDAQEEDL